MMQRKEGLRGEDLASFILIKDIVRKKKQPNSLVWKEISVNNLLG